jgi:hypothetical protein
MALTQLVRASGLQILRLHAKASAKSIYSATDNPLTDPVLLVSSFSVLSATKSEKEIVLFWLL